MVRTSSCGLKQEKRACSTRAVEGDGSSGVRELGSQKRQRWARAQTQGSTAVNCANAVRGGAVSGRESGPDEKGDGQLMAG